MTVDHDADIDTDDLVEAKASLRKAVEIVGDVPSLLQAGYWVDEALAELVDRETFEDKLTGALEQTYRAEDSVGEYRRYLSRQYYEGRVRLANAEFVFLDARLIDAADALSRWIDYGQSELRQIAA